MKFLKLFLVLLICQMSQARIKDSRLTEPTLARNFALQNPAIIERLLSKVQSKKVRSSRRKLFGTGLLWGGLTGGTGIYAGVKNHYAVKKHKRMLLMKLQIQSGKIKGKLDIRNTNLTKLNEKIDEAVKKFADYKKAVEDKLEEFHEYVTKQLK